MSGITVPTIDQISGATVMIKLRNLITKFITFAQEVNDKIDEPLEQATQAVNTANLASQNATRASEVATNASNVATQASEDAENAVNIVQGYDDRLNTVEDYTDAIGDNVSALDTEIHTTRPYVDTNTEQTITATKTLEKSGVILKFKNTGTNWSQVQGVDGEGAKKFEIASRYTSTSNTLALSMLANDGVTYQTLLTLAHTINTDQSSITIPSLPINASSNSVVNKEFVQATDGRNNLVHNIGDEKINGLKEFSHVENLPILHNINGLNTNRGTYKVFDVPYRVGDHIEFEISSGSNNDKFVYIIGSIRCYPTTWARGTIYLHKENVTFTAASLKWKIENNILSVYLVVDWDYVRCNIRIKSVSNYGAYYKTSNPPQFTYGDEQPVTVDDTYNFIEG